MENDWSINSVFIRIPYKPPTIALSLILKLRFFSLVYNQSNCMSLDKDFYSKLNNIAKLSVNLNVFVCFHGVCPRFSLPDDLFCKGRAWVAMGLRLKCKMCGLH